MLSAFAAGFLVVLAQGGPSLPPSGVRLGIALGPEIAAVGEPVTMTVRVQVPAGARVTFPAAVDSTGSIEPLDPVLVRDSVTGNVRAYTATYRFVAWETGRVVIPVAPLIIETGTRVQTLRLGDPVLTVRSVLPADSALHVPQPARDIIALPSARWAWWWLLLAAAVIAVGGGWWLQRRSRTARAPDPAPATAAETAFAALEALALPALGEAGRHAAAAAAILRTYLAAREPDVGLGLTTDELRVALREQTAVPEYRVIALLDAVDRMQFAGGTIDPAMAAALAREAREIIAEVQRADEHRASRP